MQSKHIIIVTGLSGSGKTLALKNLEDLGCEVIDNLPISFCLPLIQKKVTSGPIAFGIDVRTREFEVASFLEHIDILKNQLQEQITLLFLEATGEVIHNRYRTTRRIHPFGTGNPDTLIFKEIQLLEPIKRYADIVIDTSFLSPPEMYRVLQRCLSLHLPEFLVSILSFAFRSALPRHVDFLFDMRFLKNPYYRQDLSQLTGKTGEIKEYLQEDESFASFFHHLCGMFMGHILPQMKESNRQFCLIGFGCTGGRHRSVGTAEIFSDQLRLAGYHTHVHHRDLI